jgi:hypothetical protein
MDKKIVGIVGAITGLAAIDQSQAAAATTPAPQPASPRSFAELLDPIPNAVAALRAADAVAAREAAAGGQEPATQVAGMKHHHHANHHHHHRVKKPKPKPHHHHHHHFST